MQAFFEAWCKWCTSCTTCTTPRRHKTGWTEERPRRPWLTLLRQRAFVRVTLVAALVLGSHAMYDFFAAIRWSEAGISPATIGVLWSEFGRR